MRQELLVYIEEKIMPRYQGVDPAYDQSHILTVRENAMHLAASYDVDKEMVYVIASYHDVGICYGRDDHEITSARELMKDEVLRKYFNEKQMLTMKEAIEDYRASSSHEPRSIYGKIIAEADRDLNPSRIILRCAQFAKSHNPSCNNEELLSICLHHLQEKYGVGGYLKLYLDDPRNVAGLNKLREYIASGEIVPLVQNALEQLS